MQPMQGELVIMLTSDEAEELKRALATLLSNKGGGNREMLTAILEKLRAAEEKML